MPYYVFEISEGVTELVKDLHVVQDCSTYKEAKKLARELRSAATLKEGASVKVIFADNVLHAEELLQTKRDKPILQEWEK